MAAHRSIAEGLLDLAKTYPPNSSARLATLTEAQVHATFALLDAAQPSTVVNVTAPEDAPKAPARRRKAAPEEEAAK